MTRLNIKQLWNPFERMKALSKAEGADKKALVTQIRNADISATMTTILGGSLYFGTARPAHAAALNSSAQPSVTQTQPNASHPALKIRVQEHASKTPWLVGLMAQQPHTLKQAVKKLTSTEGGQRALAIASQNDGMVIASWDIDGRGPTEMMPFSKSNEAFLRTADVKSENAVAVETLDGQKVYVKSDWSSQDLRTSYFNAGDIQYHALHWNGKNAPAPVKGAMNHGGLTEMITHQLVDSPSELFDALQKTDQGRALLRSIQDYSPDHVEINFTRLTNGKTVVEFDDRYLSQADQARYRSLHDTARQNATKHAGYVAGELESYGQVFLTATKDGDIAMVTLPQSEVAREQGRQWLAFNFKAAEAKTVQTPGGMLNQGDTDLVMSNLDQSR